MIFDAEALTAIIRRYRADARPQHVSDVIAGSVGLAEVIASQFSNDGLYREDMIQACLVKVPYIMDKFDPDKGHLHKYTTAAFRNTCISLLTAEQSHGDGMSYEDIEYTAYTSDDYPMEQQSVLIELITFMRDRFPSIATDVVDEMCVIVFGMLMDNNYNTKMLTTTLLAKFHHLNRNHVIVFYRACVVWLRAYYQEYTKLDEEPDSYEFTLLPELNAIIGDTLYADVRLQLRGMNVVVPL